MRGCASRSARRRRARCRARGPRRVGSSTPRRRSAIFPSSATWDVAWADLSDRARAVPEAVAPVPYEAGWALLGSSGSPSSCSSATPSPSGPTAAARRSCRAPCCSCSSPPWATEPGSARRRWLLVAAGFLAVALLRARFASRRRPCSGRAGTRSLGLAGRRRRGRRRARAWASAPACPGAEAEAWIDTRDAVRGGVTEIVSPLVDIRSRLVDQAPPSCSSCRRPTSRVLAGQRRCPSSTGSVGLPERSLDDVAATSTEARQERCPTSSGSRSPPSAGGWCRPPPTRSAWSTARGSVQRGHSTLVRTTATWDAATCTTSSRRCRPSPPTSCARRRRRRPIRSTSNCPTTSRRRCRHGRRGHRRRRPPTVRPMVARCRTGSAPTSTTASRSRPATATRRSRRSCEQPDRLLRAVRRHVRGDGPLARASRPGSRSASRTGRLRGPTAYSVLGKNAHAWPEVWFDGYGWVPFEPTPGRAAPGAEGYTGVLPRPGRDGPAAATAGPTTVPTTPTTAVRRRRRSPTSEARHAEVRTPAPPTVGPSPDGRRGSVLPWPLLSSPPSLGWRRRRAGRRAPVVAAVRCRRRRPQIAELWQRAPGGRVDDRRRPPRPGADPARAGAGVTAPAGGGRPAARPWPRWRPRRRTPRRRSGRPGHRGPRPATRARCSGATRSSGSPTTRLTPGGECATTSPIWR